MLYIAIPESSKQWWGVRRLSYNLALALAGIVAFIAYVALAWGFEERFNQLEITQFTVIFQAFGYLIFMAIANVFYFLGPLSEGVLKPSDPYSYRTLTYRLGLCFSVALPLLVPGVLVYDIVAGA
jgi:hypothetical protein